MSPKGPALVYLHLKILKVGVIVGVWMLFRHFSSEQRQPVALGVM